MDVPAAAGGERRGRTTLFPLSHSESGRPLSHVLCSAAFVRPAHQTPESLFIL